MVKIESDFRLTTNKPTHSAQKERVGEKQKRNLNFRLRERATGACVQRRSACVCCRFDLKKQKKFLLLESSQTSA